MYEMYPICCHKMCPNPICWQPCPLFSFGSTLLIKSVGQYALNVSYLLSKNVSYLLSHWSLYIGRRAIWFAWEIWSCWLEIRFCTLCSNCPLYFMWLEIENALFFFSIQPNAFSFALSVPVCVFLYPPVVGLFFYFSPLPLLLVVVPSV